MSHQATTWALEQRVGSPARKMVLLVIANYVNHEGRGWPSQKLIAQESEQSERAVRDHVEALDKAGFFKRVKRRSTRHKFLRDEFIFDVSLYTSKPSADSAAGPKPKSSMKTPPADSAAGSHRQIATKSHRQILPLNLLLKDKEEPIKRENTRAHAKGIDADWMPKAWASDRLAKAGVGLEIAASSTVLAAFVAHYRASDGPLRTEEQWGELWVKWCIGQAAIEARANARNPVDDGSSIAAWAEVRRALRAGHAPAGGWPDARTAGALDAVGGFSALRDATTSSMSAHSRDFQAAFRAMPIVPPPRVPAAKNFIGTPHVS